MPITSNLNRDPSVGLGCEVDGAFFGGMIGGTFFFIKGVFSAGDVAIRLALPDIPGIRIHLKVLTIEPPQNTFFVSSRRKSGINCINFLTV